VDSFQTNCYSENLVATGIEPGTSGLQPGITTTRPQKNYLLFYYFLARGPLKFEKEIIPVLKRSLGHTPLAYCYTLFYIIALAKAVSSHERIKVVAKSTKVVKRMKFDGISIYQWLKCSKVIEIN
jgi:hypothetical protein